MKKFIFFLFALFSFNFLFSTSIELELKGVEKVNGKNISYVGQQFEIIANVTSDDRNLDTDNIS